MPISRTGPRTFPTLPTRWAMDKYYGLIALLVVVLGIAGVFVWVYFAPAMRAQVQRLSP